jgi:transcriptional regulator with XRE-family HTH domain
MPSNVVGARLREARRTQGLTLRGLAQSLGISASLLSQVETGKSQPSVSTLYAIANALDLSLDELLDVGSVRGDPAPATERGPQVDSSVVVQRAGHNPTLEMENGVRWERLAVAPGDGFDPVLVTYAPGASSSVEDRFMRHSGTEHALILEGRLSLRIDFDTIELAPGDSIRFDAIRPHLYVNRTDEPARGVWFVTGRQEHNDSMPADPDAALRDPGALTSAVDVLRAMDDLGR